MNYLPPALIPKAREALRILGKWRQPIQSHCYAWGLAPDAYVDDRDCPYVTPPDRPFLDTRQSVRAAVLPFHSMADSITGWVLTILLRVMD